MTRGTLVVVKVGVTSESNLVGNSDCWNAVAFAINHIISENRQGKSVINFSLGESKLTATSFIIYTNLLSAIGHLSVEEQSQTYDVWFRLLKKAEDEGIIFVTTAGNSREVVIPTKLSFYIS